jgi:phosphatidylserine synthase
MPFTPSTQTNSNGVNSFAVGKIVTDATTAAAATIALGFTPRYVRLINLTDRITDEWFEGMASASSLHTVAVGTLTLEATNGIAVVGSSFTLTAATLVASKTYFWEAAA